MSDHWKSLLNQFGIPGPAEPPEEEETATDEPAADPAPAPAATSARAVPSSDAGARPASQRKVNSMWGDDPSEEADDAPDAPAAETRSSDVDRDDPLSAIVASEPDPAVPGFQTESAGPRQSVPPKQPAKRSTWDSLISTLGIRSKAADEPREEPEVEPSRGGGRGGAERARGGLAAAPQRGTNDDDEGDQDDGGFAAGLLEPERSDEQRPRGRGRRGGARRRGTGRQPSDQQQDRDDSPRGGEPVERASRQRAEPASRMSDDDEGPPRRRRRRGQRQRMQLDEIDSIDADDTVELDDAAEFDDDQAAPTRRRAGQADDDRDDRDESGRRRRGRRGRRGGRERVRSRDAGRGATDDRQPEEDDADALDIESPIAFGAGVSEETAAVDEGPDDDDRGRPTRRRRRRRSGRSRDAETRADVSTFDDDLEDDEEAERLRRQSRSGRREPRAPGDETQQVGEQRAARDIPTWSDTVNLLIDVNIQRRGERGNARGRGSRR